MLKKLDEELMESVLKLARHSPRRRAIHCFHQPHESLQRMVNAAMENTYVPPHKHENPDKLEIFTIMKGRVAVVTFDDNGNVTEWHILDAEGPLRMVEIPPRTWHAFVVLSREAVLYEIIEGVYDPATHKDFAPWAPEEKDERGAQDYLRSLRGKLSEPF